MIIQKLYVILTKEVKKIEYYFIINYYQYLLLIIILKMPKCLNNNNKSFKGTEKSPLGLGYCSASEKIDTIKIGKDGKEWIIKQTKSCKRWTKIKSSNTRSLVFTEDSSDEEKENNKKYDQKDKEDKEDKEDQEEDEKLPEINNFILDSNNINFDELPSVLYSQVYIPITSELEIETGLEEKFGGKIPFFIEDEKWPEINNISMTFLCQFLDPTSNNNLLYRIFVSRENNTIDFSNIIFSEENKKKQVIVKRKNEKKTFYLKPYRIDNWEKKSELLSYNDILKKTNLLDNEDLKKKYNSSKYFPSRNIKIGGTPQFNESPPIKIENYEFLQLTEENILRFKWGNDSEIAHITKNGKLYYDNI